jgi:hypothetical protein
LEQYPDDPWYALNYEEIISLVHELCDALIASLRKYSSDIESINDLIKAAQAAKSFPNIKQFFLAVLGEQGVGKSTLINALFDRNLLDSSGSSHACTAFATLLVHLEGASDDTSQSTVMIRFFDDKEILECISGQIQRYQDMYPGPAIQYEKSGEDSDTDSGESDHEEEAQHERRGTKGTSRTAKAKAAATAREFFEIIYNTREDLAARKWLESTLNTTNISTGAFRKACHERAQKRLGELGRQNQFEDRVFTFHNITDRRIADIQDIAKSLWPFVKLVTIATGHVLLRHGLCLYDLPGRLRHVE